MGDRSLDEFLDQGDDETETDDDADSEQPDAATGSPDSDSTAAVSADPGANGAAPAVDPAAVEPAASTYVRTRAGGPCADCGTTAERRWRSDAGLVCPDCKDW